MILRFYREGKKDTIAVDDGRPIVQRKAGCEAMFQYAATQGGTFISDEEILGWLPGRIGADYFYGEYPGYGPVCSGWLNKEACGAAGFKMKPRVWWSAGDLSTFLLPDDYTEYRRLTKEEKAAFIQKKLPAKAIVAPVVKKPRKKQEPLAVAVDDKVPF